MPVDLGFSVLTNFYGDHPALAHRLLAKIGQPDRPYRLLVGLSECCQETVQAARQAAPDVLLECRGNANKDPTMRVLLDLATTPFILWFDDDVVLLDGWAGAVAAFLAATRGDFDVAGYARTFERSSQYLRFLKQRPWYTGRPLQNVSVFPQGSVWMARTDYLLRHNYPDRSMVKKLDDVLLGDMLWQTSGRFAEFPDAVKALAPRAATARRGSGEDDAGWKMLDDIPPAPSPSRW
jgi:hypothetical protein